MTSSISERVRKRRDALPAAGLRPVQLWAPNTRAPGFAEECGRQADVIAAAEANDAELAAFLASALACLNDHSAANERPARIGYSC
jgi:hypothetical protein